MSIFEQVGDKLHDFDNALHGLPSEAEFRQLDQEYTTLVYADEDNSEAIEECEAAMRTIGLTPHMNDDGGFTFE